MLSKSRRNFSQPRTSLLADLCMCVSLYLALFFRLVVDEYEKTISEVLSEREREKLVHDIEVEKITNQRNQVIVYTQVLFII